MVSKAGAMRIVLALSLISALGQAEATDRQWKGTAFGSYTSTEVDTDGNGQKANVTTLRGRSSLGPFIQQIFLEPFNSLGNATTCPNGATGFSSPIVPGTGHFVVSFDRGGQLWGEIPDDTICFDTSTGIFFSSGHFTITGGSGRFEGATGSGQFSGQNRNLFLFPAGDIAGRYFGEASTTFEGTVTTPQ